MITKRNLSVPVPVAKRTGALVEIRVTLTSSGRGSGRAVELGTKDEAAAAVGRSSRRWER